MFHSYKHLFKINWQIYNVGDKPLPRPIPLDTVGMFILFLGPSFLIARPVAGILDQPYLGVVLVLDGVFTFIAKKYDPQGRPFLKFVYDFVVFFLRPRRTDLSGFKIPSRRKLRMFWDAIDLSNYYK